MTKLNNKQFVAVTRTNWGYWDGVADREAQRLAQWYRGAAKNHGHYDPDYAKGYEIGVFGGEAPPYALTGEA
jgi:hypothetical protein